MQGPVCQQGATYFNVEFDCATVRHRQSLLGRNLAARDDLELRAPTDAGIFDVQEGEPVYMYTPKLINKKRNRDSSGAYPLVLSSLNGLLCETLSHDGAADVPQERLTGRKEDSSRFFRHHTFFGVATTPCAPDLTRRNHFVVTRQGLVSMRMAADTVVGDRIVVDFPCEHSAAEEEAGAGTTACPSFGRCRLKKTLIFRPQRFDDVRSYRGMRAKMMKDACTEMMRHLQSESSGSVSSNEEASAPVLLELSKIASLCEMEIGVAVSNANKGQLAKVVIHSSCF